MSTKTDVRKIVGKNLYKYRSERNLSQVEREQLSSAAMVLIPGQHLRSLSDRSRRYIYTVFARTGKLLSEYIVEK